MRAIDNDKPPAANMRLASLRDDENISTQIPPGVPGRGTDS